MAPHPRPRAAAACHRLLLPLLTLVLPAQVEGLFSHITVSEVDGTNSSSSSVVVAAGCMASQYAGAPPLDVRTPLVAATPITACDFDSTYGYHVRLDGDLSYNGQVVYVERSYCSPASVAAMLVNFGAAGVVLGNIYEGEIPWQLTFTSEYFYVHFTASDSWGIAHSGNYVDAITNKLGAAMCMVSYADALVVVSALEAVSAVTVDMSTVVDNTDWDTSPQHINTVVRFDWTVTTTAAGSASGGGGDGGSGGGAVQVEKGSYSAPAAQALFNIPSLPGYTAPVVEVLPAMECTNLRTYGQCFNCWAAWTPFRNAVALNGSIALFSAASVQSLSCYYFYFELAYEAELAGAVGVLFGESNNVQGIFEPVGVPFDARGNTFGVLQVTSERLAGVLGAADAAAGVVVAMTATFPATDDWVPPSGPEYFPESEASAIREESALPPTTVFLAGPGANTTADPAAAAAAGDLALEALEAGQSNFAPKTLNATWAPVVAVQLATKCSQANGQCDGCELIAAAGNMVKTPSSSLSGRVAVVNASAFDCLSTAHSLVDQLEARGAAACVVVNHHDVVYTELGDDLLSAADPNAARLGIPYFNVKHWKYLSALSDAGSSWESQTADEVYLWLPPIENFTATAALEPEACAVAEMPLTELAVGVSLTSQSSSATYLTAGQASYNPASHAGVFNAPLVPLQLSDACTNPTRCGVCERSEFPFVAAAWNAGANATTPVIVAATDVGQPLPGLGGTVTAFEVASAELCFPVYYFSQLLAARGAAGVLLVNGDDSIFTLSADRYTGAVAAFSPADCEVESLSSVLTFDVPRESGLEIAGLVDSLGVPSVSIVLPFTDASGTAPESIDSHYSSWVAGIDGSDGNGGGSGGPEDGDGAVLDPDNELPGGGGPGLGGSGGGGGGILVVGAWAEWSACSMDCFGIEGFFPGTRQRNRTCATMQLGGGFLPQPSDGPSQAQPPSVSQPPSVLRRRTLKGDERRWRVGEGRRRRRLQVSPGDSSGCGDVASTDAEQCNLDECTGEARATETVDVQLYFPNTEFLPTPTSAVVDLHDNHTVLFEVLPGVLGELVAAVDILSAEQLFVQYYLAAFGEGKPHDDGSPSGSEEACYLQVRVVVLAPPSAGDGTAEAEQLADAVGGVSEWPYDDLAPYTWLKYLDADYEPTDDWFTNGYSVGGADGLPAAGDNSAVVAAGVVSAVLVVVIIVVVVVVVVERRRRALRLAAYGGVTTSVQTMEPATRGGGGGVSGGGGVGVAGGAASGDSLGRARSQADRVLTPRPYTPAKVRAAKVAGPIVTSHQVRTVQVAAASSVRVSGESQQEAI